VGRSERFLTGLGGVVGAGGGKLLQGDAERAQRHGVVHVQSEEPVPVRPHGGHQSHAVSGGQVRTHRRPRPLASVIRTRTLR
jgi:hypothetical protein